MKDTYLHSFIKSERRKLVFYVRSLLQETAAMDAEDIVHDVLVRILEKADLLVPADNLGAYIYRSLKNRVIDYIRTRKSNLSLVDDVDEENGRLVDVLRDIKPDALELMLSREGEAELFRALDGLGDMEKEVIVAHEFEGIPFKELAARWNIPQNTLLSHKSRAMKKLKRHFIDLDGGTL